MEFANLNLVNIFLELAYPLLMPTRTFFTKMDIKCVISSHARLKKIIRRLLFYV